MQKAEFLKLNYIDVSKPIVNNLGIPWEIVAYLNKDHLPQEDDQKLIDLHTHGQGQGYAELMARSKKSRAQAAERDLIQGKKAKSFYKRFKFALRFAVTFAIIFALLFSVTNYSAFKQIVSYKIKEYSGEVFSDNDRQILREIEDSQERMISHDLRDTSVSNVEKALYDAKREVLDFSAYTLFPPDDRIVIPRLNKNIPLQQLDSLDNLINQNWTAMEQQIQDKLLHGALLYPGTVEPGFVGNTTITAHSSYYPWARPKDYIDAFALLPEMKVGDTIVIFYHGQKFNYKVNDIFEVEPDETSVLEQSDEHSELTLITCSPVGTTLRRLIIKAEQTSPDPQNNPQPNRSKVLIKSDHLQS